MDFQLLQQYWPDLLKGAWLTVQLVSLSLLIGFILAALIALAALSRYRICRYAAQTYIFIFRGSPLLVQIYLIYYGSSQIGWVQDSFLWAILIDAYWCALIALTLNTSAYTAEIIRGAMANVPQGAIEAGQAFGMSRWLLLRRIIWPQAFRLMLPAYSNEVIQMLHASSLVGAITLLDLTAAAQNLISRTYASNTFYLAIAFIYLATTYLISGLFRLAEKRLYRHLNRSQ
ncbi:MAG: ABC transporter permease subunit [Rhodospirillaceae bacterium]|nr:ABC transporter permease subunit [Rhodospirillaceae bacterium]